MCFLIPKPNTFGDPMLALLPGGGPPRHAGEARAAARCVGRARADSSALAARYRHRSKGT
jgi:hypothetical protein